MVNHLVYLCVQTFQHRLPRSPPKPHFSTLLLDFLTQVEQSVEIAQEFDSDRLVIIGGVDYKTNARLYAANLSSKMQPAATALAAILHEWKVLKLRNRFKIKLQVVHQTGYTFYGVINMFNLVVRHRLHHGLATMERLGGGRSSKIVHRYLKVDNFNFDGSKHVNKYHLHHISIDRKGIDVLSYISEFLFVNMSNVPRVAVSKTDEVNSGILQAANQILILFIKGGSIVVKQDNSIRLYGLDVMVPELLCMGLNYAEAQELDSPIINWLGIQRSSMEDQIYQTIKDSIKVMTDTLSKDLTNIHSMLRELVGTLTMSKPGTVEFQRFFGENPELWISQAECYFKFYEIT
ncbi:hypothetical protein MTR67_041319 [Solanum verrucosum]|uniref:Uncharacterized protein n=1 Tax=Solanum verrucosum TaxID=315347 RepID=A0AAF0UL96_SOLVR|nr:hypothetical protein MTR67_041319 [Solanum verrucosum]